jgi:HAD superfamily hydrolase (TIGR01509 family)
VTGPLHDDGRRACDLVIFDCDGVLVDSEPIANRVFAAMLTEIGLPMSVEDTIRTFVGRSMRTCLDIVHERLGRTAPEGFEAEFRRRCAVAFAAELRPVPGVERALDRIAQATCVASSGDHAKLRTTLALTGLLPRFDGRIFSATEVAHGKPAPDLFLHAARRMGVAPDRCVVVEDTTVGVQAAVAAGMRVLGYARTMPARSLEAAGALAFDDMTMLPDLLAMRSSRRPSRS